MDNYFKSNQLAQDVWKSKYALKDLSGEVVEQSPEDMHKRMSKEFARISQSYGWDNGKEGLSDYGKLRNVLDNEEVFSLFDKFKHIIPQGSIMSGLGDTFRYKSLSNCIVVDDVVDSYGGIMYSDQQLAQLMKRRCGVGVDISKLRPKGTITKNAAKTSTGAVSFLKRFSDTTNEVAQEGRRGALMVTLSCKHPDIMEFISSKDASDKITGANISVKWTEDFIDAVKNEEEYTLLWPVDSSVEEAEITKVVDAKEVFTQAAMYAHGYDQEAGENAFTFGGDPGCMFIDRMIEYSTDCGYPGITVLSTNPCQPGYSTLLTSDGLKKMKDVEVGDVVWSEDGWVNVINKINTGVKSVYKYKTTAGTFHSTKNHRIKQQGEKIEIQNADQIDLLQGSTDYSSVNLQAVLDGLMIGDGSYHRQSKDPFYLNIGKNDQDYFDDPVSQYIHESHAAHHNRANKVTTTLDNLDLCDVWDREVPEKYFYGNSIDVRSFLRGLYSANGSICGNRVTLKTTSSALVNQVQEMLSSVSIRSYFTTNKSTKVQHHNGEYKSKESYDVNITSDRDIFYNTIGFIQNYKMDKLKTIIENTTSRDYTKSHEIINVEYVGDLPVYDITVDGPSHTYWTHGFNSSNCGEIGMHNDCCRLIALNFMSAIENPFQDNAHINITKLYKIAYEQQVLLDNLVDLEIEAIDRIIEKVKSDSEDDKYKRIELETWNDLRNSAIEVRRTGGGFTALGDALAALGVEYGSEEGNKILEELMKVKFKGEWDASIDLAIQRGSFPKWDSQYDSTEFFAMMEEEFPNIYKRNNQYGRRNISLSTVAPTGSVSLLANINGEYGTTSGIEPVFSTKPNVFWYTRNKKSQEGDPVDYTDEEGNDWMQYKVFHEGFKQWLEQNKNRINIFESDTIKNASNKLLKEAAKHSPYVTSAELDYKQRIKVQSIVQKYTTHSISSTLNLPQDAHWSTTEDIYMKAYDAGLKGVTIFRDGSKRGVLESSDNSSDNSSIVYNDAPKRPDVLDADVYIVRNSWTIVVGKLEDKPYEVFAIDGDTFCDNDWELVQEDINSYDSYTVEKVRSKRYKLFGEEELILGNTLDWSPSSDIDVLTRFVSMLMRHGVKMDYIVEQVEKADITITDFSNILNSVLRQYTTEEYTSTVDCDKCNGENVHYIEGCLVCKECGMSKCG